jgi:hypothetical protein
VEDGRRGGGVETEAAIRSRAESVSFISSPSFMLFIGVCLFFVGLPGASLQAPPQPTLMFNVRNDNHT